MDAKDLIETLATIGIFAISVGAGLLSEYVKKRKAASRSPRHFSVSSTEQDSFEPEPAWQPQPPRQAQPAPQRPPRQYSFTAEEEGGCALEHDHDASAEQPMQPVKPSDEERRQLLETLVIGEILAKPKFKD